MSLKLETSLFASVTKYSIEDTGFVLLPAVTICIMNPLERARVQKWLSNCSQISNSNLQSICQTYAQKNFTCQEWAENVTCQKCGRLIELELNNMQFELQKEFFHDRLSNCSHIGNSKLQSICQTYTQKKVTCQECAKNVTCQECGELGNLWLHNMQFELQKEIFHDWFSNCSLISNLNLQSMCETYFQPTLFVQ